MQNLSQKAFNVGRSFLKIENAPSIGGIRFDYSGQSQIWSQNAIHSAIGIDHFKSNAANSFQVTK